MDNIDSKIKRIKQEDKTLVHETLQVLATLDEHLSLNVDQDVSDCLDRIQREVQKVKFVKGEVGGGYYGRIDIGKWELVKSILIPLNVNNPLVRGLISDDEIIVLDSVLADHKASYVVNISTGHTEEVIEGNSKVIITSCAPIDSNVILCCNLRRTVYNWDQRITLYDRQWKVIRDISIYKPGIPLVYIDVDRDGMILAAPSYQSNIYVINPADGKIVNTITMQSKVVEDGIQALSSGDIVVNTDVRTGTRKFTVISRSGKEKSVIHSGEWFCPWCLVDKMTDTLYITYWNKERNICAVDQASCDGIIQARRIVEYEEKDRSSVNAYTCLVTPSGNLVACNGVSLLVYKKSFIV